MEPAATRPMRASRSARLGSRLRTTGWLLFVASLFLYRSYESRPILARWSVAYALALTLVSASFVAYVVRAIRNPRLSGRSESARACVDLGVLLWGAAYLASAVDDRDAASRFLDLNLFGSVAPVPALLEWGAMVLLLAGASIWTFACSGARGRRLVLLAASCASVAVLGEGFVRVRAAIQPETQAFPTYTSRQWTRRHVERDWLGFRDRVHPQEPPEGTRRVLILGDSYAFGEGIERLEDRFGERLAQALGDETGTPWSSMSAALPDSDTLDLLEYVDRTASHRRDAAVIVYVFNDIDYLSQVTSRTILSDRPEGLLGRIHPARLAFLNSYLFQEIAVRARSLVFSLRTPSVSTSDPYFDSELLARHLDDLERVVERASRPSNPTWIVPFDIEAGPNGRTHDRYQHFVAALKARGLRFVALNRAFRDLPPESLVVNALDWHPNERAHRMAARAVAAYVAGDLSGSPPR